MELNYRKKLANNSENAPPRNLLQGKAMANKTATTALNNVFRRPALGDINNKIHSRQEIATKKPAAAAAAALPKALSTNITTTRTLISHRDKTKLATNIAKPTILQQKVIKREESIVISNKPKIEKKEIIHPPLSYSSRRLELEDPDRENDPHLVSEYINDIFAYLRALELKYTLDPLFLVAHRTTVRMRTVLINWLVEVHNHFKLLQETMFLSVSIVDRYLQKNKTVGRNNLQLVGATALFVAAKYEEVYMPEIGDFEYMCDHTHTRREITRMELSIMKSLDYSFGQPLSIHFLRRFSKVGNVQPKVHHLSKYLLELSMIEHDLCHLRPSLQAAAACCLSLTVFNEDHLNPDQVWSDTLVHYTRYTFADLEKVVKLMAGAVVKQETTKYKAIRVKYSHSSLQKISLCDELKGDIIKELTQ